MWEWNLLDSSQCLINTGLVAFSEHLDRLITAVCVSDSLVEHSDDNLAHKATLLRLLIPDGNLETQGLRFDAQHNFQFACQHVPSAREHLHINSAR